MDWLTRDVRIGLRLLLRDKAYSVTAVLTLAVCIGANAALFAVVHHVLLRPLPVPEPERLLLMSNSYPRAGAVHGSNSGVPDYYDRRRETDVFEEHALFNRSSVAAGQDDGQPTRLRVANVTPSFFRLVRVAPLRGRVFGDAEGEVGSEKKVVLSESLWRSRFGGDPAAVGKDMRLDGEPYEVVGVMPAAFEGFDPGVTLWRPLAFTPEQKSDERRHSNNYWNVGRLKPGQTRERAQAQVDALNARNLERFPQFREVLLNAGFRTEVERLQDHLVEEVQPTLHLLWGGALFVLLIGCVNVANLALVRASARRKELATRLALGAERAHVARLLAVEGMLLALLAAGLGLLLGSGALWAASALALEQLPRGSGIRFDWTAAAYALALSLPAGAMIGLLPLLGLLPGSLSSVLREEGRSTSGSLRTQVLRRSLVVAQVAFTFVLLAGASLLLASFAQVLRVDPGFGGERVLTASVSLPRSRYPDDAALRGFTSEALARLRALPGVAAAGATDTIPFGGRNNDSVILAEGHQMKPGESVISPSSVDATPGYFEAMGAQLLRGRFFEEADRDGALPVLIVDEKLARRFWPGQDPIGRRMYRPADVNDLFEITDKTVFLTVVGVIRDLKLHDLTEGDKAVGAYYFPMAQDTSRLVTFALRTQGRPEAAAGGLRAAVAALDPELPLFDLKTMAERTDAALLGRRSPAYLSLGFSAVALLLSAVGLYGVLAYLVRQRSKEIGIRLALGGSARSIFGLVLREGLLLVGAGFVLGGIAAVALRNGLEGQLFGVRASDPGALAAAVLALFAVALLACALPARRATRIDPLRALAE